MRLQVLKNTNFRKLFLANVINRFGDSVDSIAFTWLTYTMTKSASLSAIVFAANILPTVIVQAGAGCAVDVYCVYVSYKSDRSVPCAGGSIFRAEASGRKGTG